MADELDTFIRWLTQPAPQHLVSVAEQQRMLRNATPDERAKHEADMLRARRR